MNKHLGFHEKGFKPDKIIIYIVVSILVFSIASTIITATGNKPDYGEILEMLIILPAFFLLTGILEEWLSTDLIAKYLGNQSGVKGNILSFILGALMIGPLYMSFPLSVILLKKGISKFNVALFISAWSVFPIGQEIFELQFMGLKFFILRALLSIPFVILISVFLSKSKGTIKD